MDAARGSLPMETRNLIEELRAHEMELEIQNQQLRELQIGLQSAVDRYRELYDLAPVGYLILDEGAAIVEANLTAADILGAPRGSLPGKRLSAFVLSEDQDIFFLEVRRLLGSPGQHRCELRLGGVDRGWSWVQLDFHREAGEGEAPDHEADGKGITWCTVTDASERKRAQEALVDSRNRLRGLAAEMNTVREEERARVSLQLCDAVGQDLVALHMDLSSPPFLGFETGSEGARRVDAMKETLESCLRTITTEMVELRPPELDMLGLQEAIRHEVKLKAKPLGLEVQLDLPDESIPSPREARTEVFRIFQEALRNAVRHAQARTLEVVLSVSASKLLLEVADDGIGITEEGADGPRSFGLMGALERARRMGGRMEVLRRPDGGTRFRLEVPITPP